MNERVRKLFEVHTVPNFGPFDRNVGHLNERGEYYNPVIEDHWQTFQEAVELAIKHSMEHLKDNDNTVQALELQYFWYK